MHRVLGDRVYLIDSSGATQVFRLGDAFELLGAFRGLSSAFDEVAGWA